MADTIRNVEDLNLDDIDEELLTDQAIAMGKALGVDTREGSVYMDAAAGHIARTAEFFDNLREVRDILSIFTCTGDVLDEYLAQRNMSRNPPEDTQATYKCYFVGAKPKIGATMIVDEEEFTVTSKDKTDNTCWYIQSVGTGSEMNSFASGTAVIPDDDIDGLESCTLGELSIPAQDSEDDDSARARFIEDIKVEIEPGNTAQVHKWCMSVAGVGRAEIVPKWKVSGPVEAYITSTAGTKPSDEVIKAVQDYVDPGAKGQGEGMASIGEAIKVIAVENFAITVSAKVYIDTGTDQETVSAAIINSIKSYFANLALTAKNVPGTDKRQVSINRVGSLIMNVNGVRDYSDLLLNSSSANPAYPYTQVPTFDDSSSITFSVYDESGGGGTESATEDESHMGQGG